MSLRDKVPPLPGATRERWIIDQAWDGHNMVADDLSVVRTTHGDYEAEFEVTNDSTVRLGDQGLDPFRLACTTDTYEQILAMRGLHTPTTKLVDAIEAQASVQLQPHPRSSWQDGTMAYTSELLAHSDSVDAERAGRNGSRATTGKSYVLSPKLAQHLNSCAIYGWRGIQPLYFGHGLIFCSYAEEGLYGIKSVRYRRAGGTWSPILYSTLLADEDLCGLASNEGPIPFVWHPGLHRDRQTQYDVYREDLPYSEACVAWCIEQMNAQNPPSAATLADWFGHAERNGKPLGIKSGNHCAISQSMAALAAHRPGIVLPHRPRASVREIQADALANRIFHTIAEARAGTWLPQAGDLVLFDRSVPGRPETAWWGHVSRVIEPTDSGRAVRTIGANEGPGGAWVIREVALNNPRIVGFVDYPDPDVRSRVPPQDLLTDEDVEKALRLRDMAMASGIAEYFETDYIEDR